MDVDCGRRVGTATLAWPLEVDGSMAEETPSAVGAGLTPRKCRAAMALLGWTVRDLGRRTGIGHRPIRLWERGLYRDGRELAARLHTFIVAAGVEFRDDGSVWLSDEDLAQP